MSVQFAPVEARPDLVFGLAGPIGVDLLYIQQSIRDAIRSFDYEAHEIRVSTLMRDVQITEEIIETDLAKSFSTKMNYANALRSKFKSKDLLAALAVAAIRAARYPSTAPAKGRAFIVRQIKTPEEVQLLRSVYGRLFVLVSIYGDPKRREDTLTAEIKIDSKGSKDDDTSRSEARNLITRDTKEEDAYGQNLSNAFSLGDLFIDSDNRTKAAAEIVRFLNALFGSNEVTPTREEYGMYLAKSASLRSSDLSRQVGAALFCDSGEVISLGCNEVPKAKGGTYWTGDKPDGRDIMLGYDPNEVNKIAIFGDIIKRLVGEKDLTIKGRAGEELIDDNEIQLFVRKLLSGPTAEIYRESRIMDIIEFGRIIHAEMSAICDAARNGISTKRSHMYVTTFPCHLCAKHIVASGVSAVTYLEPYPKSYARELHKDSIQVDEKTSSEKVAFQPFMGISPYRFRDLFEKGKRKDKDGRALKWKKEPRRVVVDVVTPSYLSAEAFVIGKLAEILAEHASEQSGLPAGEETKDSSHGAS